MTCTHEVLWDAEAYNKNSLVQKSAAEELLQKIKFTGQETVLDVGCGDGKITAQIANNLTNGQVDGIDISQQMISFAKINFVDNSQRRNLNFYVRDSQAIRNREKYDVIFSSFSIQWAEDKEKFFKGALKALKKNRSLGNYCSFKHFPHIRKCSQYCMQCHQVEALFCTFFSRMAFHR